MPLRIGITGHRGLPGPVARDVRRRLAVLAAAYDPAGLIAVSCLADGPDTWWAQEVLAAGGRLEAVVPAGEYRAGLPDWHHHDYDTLLNQATTVHRTGLAESTSQAHQAGSELLIDRCDKLLAVWDGLPARGFGGTADAVAYAHRTNTPVTVLWPEGASR
ncbi:hypothetical protein [Streptomyces clavuligerus]|uniref:Uncharacterized protein n=1 Tax=Streptomyces clavuligerus TaxID=1901 RepID=D5SJ26_STRCL|nr:hypothetical protein [Streptomyces clavuligerus]EFG03919.1 Hypothetical protein SCLAV_p0429 [Streptomyces clavuligerus]MBY6307576.1 hypothetical protein [Streptomyces clavuligerus]QCS09870.1 hypothetical protein CRV15_30185 [Streptomyces clavuligerus]QPJ98084.1 hypothetical protein GE265_34245 [Streptomyces clavuligerus]WDN56575.1 hypothetical protein LL058_32640 [Streptomyces clavuligerus]